MLFLNLWIVVSAVFIDPPDDLFNMNISISSVLMPLDSNITAKVLRSELDSPFVTGSYAP
jgi:hypothetical protein